MTSHFWTKSHSCVTKDCTCTLCMEKKICSHLHLLFSRSCVWCLLASRFAVCSVFGLLFGSKSLVCCLVVSLWFAVWLVSYYPQHKYCACDLLKPEGSARVPLLVYFICSRTRSPRLWFVSHGNSCIWFSSSCNRKSQSYLVKYRFESVEEYTESKILRVNLNHRMEMQILSTLLIKPGEILKSVARSLFAMK